MKNALVFHNTVDNAIHKTHLLSYVASSYRAHNYVVSPTEPTIRATYFRRTIFRGNLISRELNFAILAFLKICVFPVNGNGRYLYDVCKDIFIRFSRVMLSSYKKIKGKECPKF